MDKKNKAALLYTWTKRFTHMFNSIPVQIRPDSEMSIGGRQRKCQLPEKPIPGPFVSNIYDIGMDLVALPLERMASIQKLHRQILNQQFQDCPTHSAQAATKKRKIGKFAQLFDRIVSKVSGEWCGPDMELTTTTATITTTASTTTTYSSTTEPSAAFWG